MWHAFDIMTADLEVDPAVRVAAPHRGQRRVYGERIVRWFADKSGKGQWPALVDRRPGLTLITPPTDSAPLLVTNTSNQGAPVTRQIKLRMADDPWRTPQSWEIVTTFGSADQPSSLSPTREVGRFINGQVSREEHGGQRMMKLSSVVTAPGCLYGLLSDFPIESIDRGELAALPRDAWLAEGMLDSGGATVVAGSPGNSSEHALANGLRCFTLTPALGMPIEFWVNAEGLTVYLFEGPTRAFVLESVEAAP